MTGGPIVKYVNSYEYEKMKHALYEYHHCMNEAVAKLQRFAKEFQATLCDDVICHILLDSSVDKIIAQWVQAAEEAKNIADTMYGGF
jgi:hypothetical protein